MVHVGFFGGIGVGKRTIADRIRSTIRLKRGDDSSVLYSSQSELKLEVFFTHVTGDARARIRLIDIAILVYSISDEASFQYIRDIAKYMLAHKRRLGSPHRIWLVGNKSDLSWYGPAISDNNVVTLLNKYHIEKWWVLNMTDNQSAFAFVDVLLEMSETPEIPTVSAIQLSVFNRISAFIGKLACSGCLWQRESGVDLLPFDR
jgi:hypothetical protein